MYIKYVLMQCLKNTGGDLIVTEKGYLELQKDSHIEIKRGQLLVDKTTTVILSKDSSITNGDRVVGGGELR